MSYEKELDELKEKMNKCLADAGEIICYLNEHRELFNEQFVINWQDELNEISIAN